MKVAITQEIWRFPSGPAEGRAGDCSHEIGGVGRPDGHEAQPERLVSLASRDLLDTIGSITGKLARRRSMATYGLFVGIDNYPAESGFTELRYASSDAAAIRSVMINTPTGLNPATAILLNSETAKSPILRKTIVDHILDLATLAAQDDTLVFYFAGHGFFSEFSEGRGSYLAPVDVTPHPRDGRPHTAMALSVGYIRQELMESSAQNILIILDACREDSTRMRDSHARVSSGFSSELSTHTRGQKTEAGRTSVIISACTPDSVSIEDDKIKAGVWTHCFCTALDRHADQKNREQISSKTVFDTANALLTDFKGPAQEACRYPSPLDAKIELLHPIQVKATAAPPVADSPWTNLRKEIDHARKRIGIRIGSFEPPTKTPLLRSRRLENLFGCKRLYFKLESIQNTGSFKYRGATNAIEKLHEEGKEPVIVTSSAGNHGLGLAVASEHRGYECHVFMPENTPQTKITAIRKYTKHTDLVGADYDACQAHAMEYAEKRRAFFVHPFDDPYVVAGQGTIGLDLIDDWNAVIGDDEGLVEPNYLIIPCGGGGLLAGIGTVITNCWQNTHIIAVEPDAVPSLHTAIEQRTPVRVPKQPTIADGIAVRCVGKNTLDCILNFPSVVDVWRVGENNIAVAMLNLMEDARILAEGAGAVPLAGMIEKAVERKSFFQNQVVICVISGGNVDISSLSAVVSSGLILQNRRATFRFTVMDRPGSLLDITKALAEAKANIEDLSHARYRHDIGLNAAEVDVRIETNDAEDAARIFGELSVNRKFKVRRLQ